MVAVYAITKIIYLEPSIFGIPYPFYREKSNISRQRLQLLTALPRRKRDPMKNAIDGS